VASDPEATVEKGRTNANDARRRRTEVRDVGAAEVERAAGVDTEAGVERGIDVAIPETTDKPVVRRRDRRLGLVARAEDGTLTTDESDLEGRTAPAIAPGVDIEVGAEVTADDNRYSIPHRFWTCVFDSADVAVCRRKEQNTRCHFSKPRETTD
jgi:hypothetical protein